MTKTLMTCPFSNIEGELEGKDVTKLGYFKHKTQVNLKEGSPGDVEVKCKSDVSIVGKLAMFGDRAMRSKAKQVEEEFIKNLQQKA